jgi:hypothetical protein
MGNEIYSLLGIADKGLIEQFARYSRLLNPGNCDRCDPE